MFCNNCKMQIPDGTAVCPNCGAPLAVPSGSPSAGSAPDAGAQLQSSKARPVLIVIACLLALLLMFLVAFSVFFNNPKAVAQRYVKASWEGKVNTVLDCSLLNKKITEDMLKDRAKEQNKTLEEYYEDWGNDHGVEIKNINGFIKATSEELQDELKEMYGKYTVSVKVTDSEKLDKDNLLILKNALEENYEDYINVKKISRATEVTVEYKIKGTNESETDTTTVTLVKYGMTWCVSPISLDDAARTSNRTVYDGYGSDDPGVYYDDYEDYGDYDRYTDYGSAYR